MKADGHESEADDNDFHNRDPRVQSASGIPTSFVLSVHTGFCRQEPPDGHVTPFAGRLVQRRVASESETSKGHWLRLETAQSPRAFVGHPVDVCPGRRQLLDDVHMTCRIAIFCSCVHCSATSGSAAQRNLKHAGVRRVQIASFKARSHQRQRRHLHAFIMQQHSNCSCDIIWLTHLSSVDFLCDRLFWSMWQWARFFENT